VPIPEGITPQQLRALADAATGEAAARPAGAEAEA
jgi:hypothetical protein